ncbi:hypothetical protein QPK24_16400 [Paenibacillus polygoni]|uniref:Uncharacterized protein n=1 Tax=Paenibacillus polygoni TaxID=3050112 RepID=A0ABY8WXX1_9BACL|nr:hypothetical protein [Paenibacillus polygoni]WIV17985.1 hypothetical protein QPK24_16400 [Paenibacillus polygoni]
MNQQLSRTQKYGQHRRRKEGKESTPSKSLHKIAKNSTPIDHSVVNKAVYKKPVSKSQPVPELSRMQRKLQAEQKQKKEANGRIQEAETLPTRAELFPSRRVRLSKWFINSLILLFILLTGFLVYWGIIGAPPLNTLIP